MMYTLLLFSLWFNGQEQAKETTIYQDLTQMERMAHQLVRDQDNSFTILGNNPIRAYYVPGTGVFLVVPVRHRPKQPRITQDSDMKPKPRLPQAEEVLADEDIAKKVAAWRLQIQKQELIKEADFEQVVKAFKQALPQLLAQLNLPEPSGSLAVVVEETPPAWYYAGFSLKKNPTRKVVTLTVDKELFNLVRANRTERKNDWLSQVKRTNTSRALAHSR